MGNVILDLLIHDTYYIIAHFHYILSLSITLSIIMVILMLR